MSLFEKKEIIDITPLISPEIAVFPGDTAFSRSELLSFDSGSNLALSSIKTTVHLGAHTDAPNHYHPHGAGIDKVPLTTYIGQCQIIEVKIEKGDRIYPKDFDEEILAPRVLFRTNSFPDPNNWNHDFNSCSPELIKELEKKGVILVGIDTPSVDPCDDKNLESHNQIYKSKMAILEGVVLTHAKAGLYELIALPLPLKDADASPVRAVLIKVKSQ